MNKIQATIYPIVPFDAVIGGTIKFNWSGNQAFKNRCIIKNNETAAVVYDKTINSFKYEHPLDLTMATLSNGNKYNAFITVFDKDNVESDPQQIGQAFICLKSPSFAFTNIVSNQVISASSYTFSLSYSKENGELLDSWSISLYTKSHSLLSTSGTQYDTSVLSHTFNGFTNKNEYSVRAVGKTVNGIDVDTGYINLSVTYSIRDVFSLLEPTNLAKQGCIQIRSNIVSSEGHPESEAVFINGEYVDLKNNSLSYTEGFALKGDFSLAIVFYNAEPNQEILKLSSSTSNALDISITYRIGKFGTDEMRACYELKATSYWVHYVRYSNIIALPQNDDKIGVLVYRRDGFPDIEIRNLGKVV